MTKKKMENTGTLIAGAGPAGLAAAACLKQNDLPFILLEKSDRIAASWHNHYDRLHLHTDKKRSELPYLSYPDAYPTYPSREQIIEYLETYADHFDLNPRLNREVVSAGYEDGKWVTRTNQETYTSENLVIATGFNNQPVVPDWPGVDKFSGRIMHSSDYENGSDFEGKQVLVVGFGNSGAEIAIDLVEHGAAGVYMSVRSPVNIIPRDLLGLPILAIAIPLCKIPPRIADLLTAPIQRVVFGKFERLGLRKMKDGPFEQIYKKEQIPLIDVGTVDLIREGLVEVYPNVTHFDKEKIYFSDGSAVRCDAVILATGYRPALETLLDEEFLSDEKKAQEHGLYFCGFYVTPTGMLREIAIEAKKIAANIKKSAS